MVPDHNTGNSLAIPVKFIESQNQVGFSDYYSLPSRFTSLSSLSLQNPGITLLEGDQAVSLVSDNFSRSVSENYSLEIGQPEPVTTTFFPLNGWNGTDIDWIEGINPRGNISVESSGGLDPEIRITVPEKTHEKGLILYSKVQVPLQNPAVSFHLRGRITHDDGLILLIRDPTAPDEAQIIAASPGNYEGTVHANLTRSAGRMVSMVLGVFHVSPDPERWEITDLLIREGSHQQAVIRTIEPSWGGSGQVVNVTISGTGFSFDAEVSLYAAGLKELPVQDLVVQSSSTMTGVVSIPRDALPGEYFVKFRKKGKPQVSSVGFVIIDVSKPAIISVTPKSVSNIEKTAELLLKGENLMNGARYSLSREGSGDILPLNIIQSSPSAITVVFPVFDAAPGRWNLTVTNPDGSSGVKEEGITITSPDTPWIQKIVPDSAENTDIVNITRLQVRNIQGGAKIFLSRTGHESIEGRAVRYLPDGNITLFFDLTDEVTGIWDLTVKNPNGKSDTIPGAFTITGEHGNPYSFIHAWPPFNRDSRKGSVSEGVAIDDADHVFILDPSQRILGKFDGQGKTLDTWLLSGTGEGLLEYPSGIAVSPSGVVYVTDKTKNCVTRFSPDGQYIDEWGSLGKEAGQFHSPSGIAVDYLEHTYVSDTNNHRIQKFSSDGRFITQWGGSGSLTGQFLYPTGIAVSDDGEVYVVDKGNNRIQKFSGKGQLLGVWGSGGSENGNFMNPEYITIDSSGSVYVTDFYNNRIQKFDPDGTFLTKWGSRNDPRTPFGCIGGIGVNSSGYVYLMDCTENRVMIFSPVDSEGLSSSGGELDEMV